MTRPKPDIQQSADTVDPRLGLSDFVLAPGLTIWKPLPLLVCSCHVPLSGTRKPEPHLAGQPLSSFLRTVGPEALHSVTHLTLLWHKPLRGLLTLSVLVSCVTVPPSGRVLSCFSTSEMGNGSSKGVGVHTQGQFVARPLFTVPSLEFAAPNHMVRQQSTFDPETLEVTHVYAL